MTNLLKFITGMFALTAARLGGLLGRPTGGSSTPEPAAPTIATPIATPVTPAIPEVPASAIVPATPTAPVSPADTVPPSPQPARDADRTLYGSMGNDVLQGGSGNDILHGGMGDDILRGGEGDNRLYGGMGNDQLQAGNGDNYIEGGMGDDIITVGHGRNTIDAGMGDDTITAGNGGNVIDGGMGDDRITSGSGDDVLTGGMGDDYLSAGGGNDIYRFDRAFGNDVIDNRDGSPTTTDKVVFEESSQIGANQMWFRRDGADLVVDVVGTGEGSGPVNIVGGGSQVITGNGTWIFGPSTTQVSYASNGKFGTLTNNGSPSNGVTTGTLPLREGKITLRDWYADAANQVDAFQDASGLTLQRGQVDSLVSAMAAFGAAPASLAALSEGQRQQLDVVIANNWAA